MDVINLKISKVGGLTKARQIRDLCVSLGIADDDRGHLGRRHHHRGHRPPRAQHAAELLFSATDFNSYVTVSIAGRRTAARERAHGRLDGAGARRAPAAEGPRRPLVEMFARQRR